MSRNQMSGSSGSGLKQSKPADPQTAARADSVFLEAWAKKESEGFQYGPDALEQVRLGWDMAMAHIASESEDDSVGYCHPAAGDGTLPYRITFPCGAVIRSAQEVSAKRLLVYDTEGGETRPCFADDDGRTAPCLLGCRRRERKETRAMRTDGKVRPARYVITCKCSVDRIKSGDRRQP